MGRWGAQDTLIVWSSDNGGDGAANNFPLRGAKFSNWEGGIRVGAFVSGGWLPPQRRGIKLDGLATLWDLCVKSCGSYTRPSRQNGAQSSIACLPAARCARCPVWVCRQHLLCPGPAGDPGARKKQAPVQATPIHAQRAPVMCGVWCVVWCARAPSATDTQRLGAWQG